jgi:hypothetical protein
VVWREEQAYHGRQVPSIMVEPQSNPTGGCSPTVQPPPSLSSHHCHCPATTIIVQPPPSSSSYHCHCLATTIIVCHRMGHVDWRGCEGHIVPCPGPAWYRGIRSLNGGHQLMLRNMSIVVPKCYNDITYLAYTPSELSIPTKAVLASLGHSFH